MAGYLIIDIEITDPEAYSEFVAQARQLVAAHGGRFLVRSDEVESLQAEWAPERLVILEFDSVDAARGYLNSAEYTALSGIRRRASNSKIVIAEGSGPAT